MAAPASAALLALLLAGCASTPSPGPAPRAAARVALPASWPAVPPERPEAANAVLMRALSLVGTPYRYGGNTPEAGFDCSGLVGYVYRDMLGRALPRSSTDLARVGDPVGPMRMASGDLVVFGDADTASHVGIYAGEGRFVHAPSTGGTVRLDRIDTPYWAARFLGGRRVLR